MFLLDSEKPYAEECADIWIVKSIEVKQDEIDIEFDVTSYGFQFVYKRKMFGEIERLERGCCFTVEEGENIGWSDGRHFSASLHFKKIKDDKAYVVFSEEHRPPASHAQMAYKRSRKCIIDKEYTINKDNNLNSKEK